MRAQWLAGALLTLWTMTSWAADAPEEIEEARTLFRQGSAAEDAHDWELAVQKYKASLAIKKSALTLHHLAVAQRESGALVAALTTFREFVDAPQSDKSRSYLPDAQAAIVALEQRVAKVRLLLPSEITNASATLDGRIVSGELTQTMLVDPGEHTVRVTAPGHQVFERRFSLHEGEANELSVLLPPTSVPPAAEPWSRPIALPIALMSGGGLVAVVGAAVGIAGFVEADGVQAASSDATRLHNMGIVADVMIPAGGVAAGIGLILYLVLPSSPDEQAAKTGSIGPSLWLGSSTIGAQWSF